MPQSITTVVFDLGGVLIDWNPRYLYRKIFDDEKEMEYFLSEICTPHWNEQQDAGRPLQEATDTLVAEFPKHEENIRAFYGRWDEMLGGPIHDTVEILRKVHQSDDYQLFALTNWSAETFPVAQERYDFLQWFEGILVSGQEMMKKPDHRIYQLLVDRFGIDASNAVFTDDNPKNAAAATESVGMQHIHFQSPAQLQSGLEKLGVRL